VPVLIAAQASDLDLVRPLARRLRADGGEVRCYLDADDHALREMGCKIAVGALDDAWNLEASLTNVHTFVPVLADPFRVGGETALAQQRVYGLSAARAGAGADLAQTILPLPALPRGHPVEAVVHEVEAAFVTGTRPLCRLRTGYLWGEERPLPAVLRGAGSSGAALSEGVCLSILDVQDWVAALAAADDREGLDGIWDLGGDVVPLVDLMERLDAGGPAPTPSPWTLALLAEDLLVGSSAARELGVSR
jgi:hypothetical protein